MKNIINKISVLVLLTGVFSCTDLEEQPVGVIAPEGFFKTAQEVETAVLGTYGHIANEEFYGRKLTLTLQLRSDMCDIGDRNTPSRRQQVNDFNMDSNNGMITAIWPRSYKIIGAANAAIAGAEAVGEPVDQINALIAEARFIRAFTYYHLVRLFGDIPYIDFFIDNPEAIEDISKTTASEVYNSIVADLQFAKENLPDNYDSGIRTRPTKGTAAAYLASVHLTLGNWEEAYTEAKWVIDNKVQFGYELMTDFQDLYDASMADGLPEHIFAVDFLANVSGSDLQNQDWMGPITGIRGYVDTNMQPKEGWSVSVPAFKVYETWDARDYRRKVSFIDSAYVDGVWSGYEKFAPNHNSPRPHIAKFFLKCGDHRGDCSISDNNYVAMRYAEVLLIAAEALAEMNEGPNAEAEGYVNEIRARARNRAGVQTDFPENVQTGLSKENFVDLVLEERRLELAFEFKRWYDIKRRQLGDEVFKGPDSLEPHENFNSNMHYLLPIPADEIQRNPNITQNTGY